jgi:hypothetical protein
MEIRTQLTFTFPSLPTVISEESIKTWMHDITASLDAFLRDIRVDIDSLVAVDEDLQSQIDALP